MILASHPITRRLAPRSTTILRRSYTATARRWQDTTGAEGRQWSTPLAKSLGEAITTTGPIPLAVYMRQCLTSPDGGYYTRQTTEGKDPFGASGDFITSPEISQVFGELVGLWILAEWRAQGRPWGTHIIELGPGRGTLMDDVLRTLSNFKDFTSTLTDVILVEASPSLRKKQHELLCGDEHELEDWCRTGEPGCWKSKDKYSVAKRVEWYEELKYVPKNEMAAPFIIAHEFFDALPIHAFQAVPTTPKKPTLTTSTSPSPIQKPQNEWRELLVAPTSPYNTQLSPSTTTTTYSSAPKKEKDDFTLVTSPAPTPFSQYLPTTSPRYAPLLKTPNSTIEISPESLTTMAELASRIGGASGAKTPHTRSGAALILDYGPTSTIPTNSLRGIRSHELTSPFSRPGDTDLSADVDFGALAHAALEGSPGVEVHGPAAQGAFLGAMGMRERAAVLVEAARGKGDEEAAERVEKAVGRLMHMGPRGMGGLYKAMAVLPYRGDAGEVRRPVGFGGSVE